MRDLIKQWLSDIGQDREWLATQLEVSKPTIDGWLAEGARRSIPKPTQRLIRYLMRDKSRDPEVSFTLAEHERIAAAAREEGVSIREWLRNAAIESLDN